MFCSICPQILCLVLVEAANCLPVCCSMTSRSFLRGMRFRPQNKLKTFHWTFAMIAATSGIFAISLSSRERVCGPQHVGIIHGYSASKSLHADFITEHVSVSV